MKPGFSVELARMQNREKRNDFLSLVAVVVTGNEIYTRVKTSSNLKLRIPHSRKNAHVAGASFRGSDRT